MKTYNKSNVKNIWGIGDKKLNLIKAFLGICKSNNLSMPKKLGQDLDITMNKLGLSFSNKGKSDLNNKINIFINLKLNKGFKRLRGLPVHGQRVKTNAKTQKRLFKKRLK